MGAFVELRRVSDVAALYVEACDRGPTWRELIFKSIGSISAVDAQTILPELVIELRKNGFEPAAYGLGVWAEPGKIR